jgi:predicted MFS family arabinose efflux permease
VIAATGALWPALALLGLPGAAALGLLLWIRARVPDPAGYEPAPGPARHDPALPDGRPPALPREFFLFAAAAGGATAGLVTFGIIGFHLTRERLLPVAAVPLAYAAAMAAAALAALASGYAYDRWSARVLYTLPALVAAVPPLALAGRLGPALAGVVVWGAAVGVQDSTVKALVADLAPAARRATAYGVFAAVQGGAAIAGGGVAGALYGRSLPALVVVVAVTQLVSLVLLAAALGGRRTRPER